MPDGNNESRLLHITQNRMNLSCLFYIATGLGLCLSPKQVSAEQMLTYDKAKDRLLKVIDEVPNSEFLTATFGPDVTPLEAIKRNWENLSEKPVVGNNPNLNTFVEIVFRYFGNSAGGKLDLIATDFQAPVYEYTLYEPGKYLPTYNDPKLLEKGLEVRRDYFLGLAMLAESRKKIQPHEWGQISVCLTEAFTWLSQSSVINANSRSLALLALKQGDLALRQIKNLSADRKLILKGTKEDLNSILLEQFEVALLNWALLSSSKNPDLFIDLDLEWLENISEKLGDANWLRRVIQNSGGKLEFVKQVKTTQSRLLKAIAETVVETETRNAAVQFVEQRDSLADLSETLQLKLGFTPQASPRFSFSDINRILERMLGNAVFLKTEEARSVLSELNKTMDEISVFAISDGQ